VVSGNWRYTYRFLSEELVTTVTGDLTNPINVYTAPFNGDPKLIIGDEPNTITPKINQLKITGILPGLFKFVELIGVNYVGDGVTGFVIKRVLLDAVQSEITLDHTGTETATTNFDLGLLNQEFFEIATAKSIDVIDKRMILTNLTIEKKVDFSAWALTITHSLFRKSLTAVRSSIAGTIVAGEFQDPQNVNNFAGYMHNETYRMGVKVRMRESKLWTQPFFVQDILINCDATFPRRTTALTDFNLTDNLSGGTDDVLFSAFINFIISDAVLDFFVDGVKVRDLVDRISFVRAEVVPTILTCGMGILGVSGKVSETFSSRERGFDSAGVAISWLFSADLNFIAQDPDHIIEYAWASGRTGGGTSISNPTYPGQTTPLADEWDARRKYAAFYSSDIWFDHTSISFLSGDKIINYGNAAISKFNNGFNSDNKRGFSNYAQYSGRSNKNSAPATDPDIVTLTDAQLVLKGGNVVLPTAGTQTFFKVNQIQAASGVDSTIAGKTTENPRGMVLLGSTDFNNPPGVGFTPSDFGIYYMQYSRALADQYGDKNLTVYVSCGHLLKVSPSSVASTENVFGGDTFTQLNYFKHRHSDDLFNGLAGSLSFYSQNRVNAQMKQKSPSQIGDLYPAISTVSWLETPSDTDGRQGEDYQEGYTLRNDVQSDVAFNPNLEDSNVFPARIIWSNIKPQGSPSDQYRNFLILNFHDLDQAFGEIVGHANAGGELITWQLRAFMRQYFNTRGTLEVRGISQVLIGDGSVMSRDGVTMSRFGTSNKWAIVKGVSRNGDDVYMWIDAETKVVAHYGANGTLTVSDEWMKSFFANNLTWVEGKDTPADDQGIHGVYDQRFNNFIFTVRGRRAVQQWLIGVTYAAGDAVFDNTTNFSTFEQTGEVFISKLSGNTGNQPAHYLLPQEIAAISGTTTITITTVGSHFLLDGDQARFTGFTAADVVLNDVFFVITRLNATQFTITLTGHTVGALAGGEKMSAVDPKFWTLVLHTDSKYYSEFTAIFGGFKVGFITFASFLPRIYNRWKNTFLSPRPISPVSKVYEHNKGVDLTWYLSGGISQQEKAFIEAVINTSPEQVKWFLSLGIDSEIPPDSMDFTTQDHKSFLVPADFEQWEGSFYSVIKEDSTVTGTNPLGLNDNNTTLLFGKYLRARFNFAVGVYQRVSNFIVRYMISDIKK